MSVEIALSYWADNTEHINPLKHRNVTNATPYDHYKPIYFVMPRHYFHLPPVRNYKFRTVIHSEGFL